ncbi:MAG TPA: toll/interleukin-1 receptor domain-containing protein, partial [Chthoniobacteraceae bacterium]
DASLHVFIVHHAADRLAEGAFNGLRRAFAVNVEEPDAPATVGAPDPFSNVSVIACADPAEFAAACPPDSARALFVVLLKSEMLDDEWLPILEVLALRLEQASLAQIPRQGALVFIHDAGDRGLFPAALMESEASEFSKLGEERMRPHNLALLALHRARLLLGRKQSGDNALRLFISHAKADGIFLADALRNFIAQVPELRGWYDADDLHAGRRWRKELESAASRSVLVAVRTEGYVASRFCRDEFEWALANGVPIIVVDALRSSSIPAAPLPFAAVPNVRIGDGNVHRVLRAALREHLRILLVETSLAESAALLPAASWQVWPRLPSWAALSRHLPDPAPGGGQGERIIVVVESLSSGVEFTAACDWLSRLQQPVRLQSVTDFIQYCATHRPAPGLPA